MEESSVAPSSNKSVNKDDYTTQQRDAKFKQWLTQKALRDRAFDLLRQLDANRFEDTENILEVAVSVHAIERLVNENDGNKKVDDNENIEGEAGDENKDINNKKTDDKKKKSLKSEWIKLSMENYTFSDVLLLPSDLKVIDRKSYEGKNPPPPPYSNAVKEYLEESKDKNGEKSYSQPSLKYSFPAQPKKPGDKVRPLTDDQRRSNYIFLRELAKLWKKASDELDDRIHQGGKSKRSGNDSKDDGSKEDDDRSEKIQSRSVEAILNDFGVRQLKEWIEEDEDKKAEEEIKDKQQKAKLARQQHENFIQKKNEYRIRIPNNLPAIPTPSMNYGGALNAVRPTNIKGATNSVEMMIGSGMKYIHASKEDFEKSKQYIKDMKNELREKAILEKKAKEESQKAFEDWIELKELRDDALKALSLMKADENGALDFNVIEVGRALKKIDRTLIGEWYKFLQQEQRKDKQINFSTANIYWDAFEPKSCDVHSATSSAVRDTFMKLLRPGVDYRKTFTDFAEKMRRYQEYKDEVRNVPSADTEKPIALSKRQMEKLLLQLGVAMKPVEIETLIDAFDANGDGQITVEEFLDFTGPKRDKKGGASLALNQRCCWNTTCKITGMANAYSVSNITARQKRIFASDEKGSKEGSRLMDDSKLMAGSKDYGSESKDGGLRTIKQLKTGEVRVRNELEERQEREKMLIKNKIIPEDNYGENDEVFEAYDEENENNAQGKDETAKRFERNSNVLCAFCQWTSTERKEGLKYLNETTKDLKQAEMIRKMLTEGNPPEPPKFWIDYLNPDENPPDAPDLASTQLQLCWAPQKNDLVSFFSVEFSRQSGTNPANFVEIFRDPKDASPDCQMCLTYLVDNLLPGTTYSFRIRGFNGFGPGNFTYKAFTTLPKAPPTPKISKCFPNSVTLKWLFSENYAKRMAELKKLFEVADADGSGVVGREELVAALDEKASNSHELRAFLKQIAGNIGLDLSQGYAALFDQIENDDDGGLTWEEFERFFENNGWGQSLVNASMNKSMRASNASLRGSMTGSIVSTTGNSSGQKHGDLTYVVEKCEDEFSQKYSEILKTTAGEGTISRLEAGKSYRFRVFSMNASGQRGPKSAPVIVHTMLETPPCPIYKLLSAKKIILSWAARKQNTSTRDPAFVQKMLGDWTCSHEDDKGVSVDVVFSKYDLDRSGSIDAKELENVLKDLGVEVSEERVREAFSVLDKNGDGTISYEEFGQWWRRDEVVYTIKRSEPILPVTVLTTQEDLRASAASIASTGSHRSASRGRLRNSADRDLGAVPEDRSVTGSIRAQQPAVNKNVGTKKQVALPIVSYRGSDCRADIAGLDPNRLYHFKLRYTGSRSNSILSPSLVIMTLPLPPSTPLICYVSSMTLRIKWYAPEFGAYKYVLQLKSPSMRRNADMSEDGWVTVFSGHDTYFTSTTMIPDADYEARVFAVNCQGNMSEPSKICTFTTLRREDTSTALTPKNMDIYFNLPCTGDIVVGDIILFSERLYKKQVEVNDVIPSGGSVRGGSVRGSKSIAVSNKSKVDMATSSIAPLLQGEDALISGVFIGERTIAAHVIKDNYRTTRDSIPNLPCTYLKGKKSLASSRILWLEVIWQKSTNDACKPYDIKSGDVISRVQMNLEQFEVTRCTWKVEEERKSLETEWNSLKDSYVQVEI